MPSPYLNFDAAVLNAPNGIERDSSVSSSSMETVARLEQCEAGKPMPGLDFTTTSSIVYVPTTTSSGGASDWDVHSGHQLIAGNGSHCPYEWRGQPVWSGPAAYVVAGPVYL